MDHQKLSRLLLGAAALALAAVFVIRLASGVNPITAGLWLAAAVLVGITAAALKPQEDKARNSVIGSGIALVLSLMALSLGVGRATAPAAREHEASAPAAPTEAATEEPETEETPEPVVTHFPHISWTQEYYVDDFNDPTDQTYLRGHFSGTFSNSATSGSALSVYLYFDKELTGDSSDYFKIRLFEYGDMLVNYSLSGEDDILVKIKIDGKTYEAHPDYLSEKDICIKRGSPIFAPIVNALNAGSEISVVITESRYSTSTYRFTVDSFGLDDIEHSWKG